MTFNQIKYFIKLAECLSFTEAAKCLFISQPALSRQIAVLEEEIGTPLLVRDRKKLKLTPGGVILYNRLPQILGECEKLFEEARHANQGYEGSLNLGFLDIYDITELFTGQIREFQEKNPGIRLSLERFSLAELPKRLYDRSLDLVLTYGFSLFDQPDLFTVPVQDYTSCIMLNAEHPLADKEDLSLPDLREEVFVQLGPRSSEEGYQYLMHLFARCGITPKIRQVEKMEDVLLWVQAGEGAAITTNRTIERYSPHVVLRPVPMQEAEGHEITLAWHKNNYNPAIAVFMELMEERLGKDRMRTESPRKRYSGKQG